MALNEHLVPVGKIRATNKKSYCGTPFCEYELY
jgi:hypothetical protein